MVLSLPGLVGAFVGLVVGLLNYAAIVAVAERRLRALDRSQGQAEKNEFERKILLLRRVVLLIVSAGGLLVRADDRRVMGIGTGAPKVRRGHDEDAGRSHSVLSDASRWMA